MSSQSKTVFGACLWCGFNWPKPSPEAVHALQAAVLDLFAGHTVAVALSGYLFFGSAVNVSQKVLEVCCSLAGRHPGVLSTVALCMCRFRGSDLQGPAETRVCIS